MARSAAAAGAAAAAAAAATAEAKGSRRTEAKSSLRVRDPGMLRMPSSVSTEAPSSKSISIVAPSPDGSASYLFSSGGSRAFGSRRQQSSSLSSYPSFGLSSSGLDSSDPAAAGDSGMFFTEGSGRSGAFSDNTSSGNVSSLSPPEDRPEEETAAPSVAPQLGGNTVSADTGGSYSTVVGSPASRAAAASAPASASATSRAQEQVAIEQPFFHQAPSNTTGQAAPSTPSSAPGGGNLFALQPAVVEHQRRARSSRAAGVGLGGRAGRSQSSSASSMSVSTRTTGGSMGTLGSSSFGGESEGADKDEGGAGGSVELDVKPRAGDVGSSTARFTEGQEKSSTGGGGGGGFGSVRRAVVAGLASVAKVATGRSGSSSGAASRSSTETSAAGSGVSGGGSKRRLSGEIDVPTGEPEAKKMMAKVGEGSSGDHSPDDSASGAAGAAGAGAAAAGAAAGAASAASPEATAGRRMGSYSSAGQRTASYASTGSSKGVPSSSYSSIDSVGTKIRPPPYLHRLAPMEGGQVARLDDSEDSADSADSGDSA